MVNVLITGGCGFIGSHLAEALLAQGDSVVVVDDLSTGRFENVEHLTANPRFHFAITTIANEMVMDRLISECDVIYHLAAAVGVELIVRDPVRVIEANVKGCEVVLRIAARYRKKVLLASTSEVYGKSDAAPFREDRILCCILPVAAEHAFQGNDEFLDLVYYRQYAPVVIMRCSTQSSAPDRALRMVVPRFVHQAPYGEPPRYMETATNTLLYRRQ